jgi:hypothetical protein
MPQGEIVPLLRSLIHEVRMIDRIGVRHIVAVILALLATRSAWAGAEDNVNTLFRQFIAAQNTHDLRTVTDIVLDSLQLLWVTPSGAVMGT